MGVKRLLALTLVLSLLVPAFSYANGAEEFYCKEECKDASIGVFYLSMLLMPAIIEAYPMTGSFLIDYLFIGVLSSIFAAGAILAECNEDCERGW